MDVGACVGCVVLVVSRAQVGPQDFEMLRVVGQGAFGKVFQVMHKGTKHIYAMKVGQRRAAERAPAQP
jgi:hypothetical protein